jgi:hypothetical protein
MASLILDGEGVKTQRGKSIELRASFVCLLHKPMRNQPFVVLHEPRIIETHSHLQIRLLHRLAILIENIEKAGENVEVGALQTRSQALENLNLRIIASLLLLVIPERLEQTTDILVALQQLVQMLSDILKKDTPKQK